MPMNNGNMPNTDGRGNGTRRTVRPTAHRSETARIKAEVRGEIPRIPTARTDAVPPIRRRMRACVKTAHGGIRERLSAQVSHDRVREMMSGKRRAAAT